MSQKKFKSRKKRREERALALGVIRIHPRGFGFLIPEERNLFPEDIFIPRRAIQGAVDGDTVEVAINPFSFSEKGPEGKVIHILKRGRSHLAGIITYVGKKHQIYAYVPLLGEDQGMRILPSETHQLKVGDRIIIHVIEWGGKRKECLGEMGAYIGHISDPLCDIPAAIEEFELNQTFSEKIIEEARSFGTAVAAKDWADRRDLRSLTCFTIDPETAKDFDDALSIKQDVKGKFYLGVHIADVSHYVKPGTKLDLEACERCNSVYFPGQVLPMLPHELSSHLCSLKPQVNRLTISVLMVLDKEGGLESYEIVKSVIKSKKRFSYPEAKEVLDGVQKSIFIDDLKLMVTLCHLLKKKRAQRGSIEFSLPDLSLQLDSQGEVNEMHLIEYDVTHQLVEEFMLLANEVVATHLNSQGKPLTYRVHEEPNPESMRDFALTASSIGFPLPENPTAEELQQLFDRARETPFGSFLATAFIRSMKLANYSTQNVGHYGLGLKFYTHFTSPIRRYIDLVVHRTLFNEIEDEEEDLEQIALRCSEKERLSAKAENSVIFLKKLRFLKGKLLKGENQYEAVVIGIKTFGVIFELKALLFEGFLPLQDLEWKVGLKIKVELVEVNLVTRQTEWELLSISTQKKKR